MVVELGGSGSGDTLGGVAGVGIDLAPSLAIRRSDNGKAGGTKVYGGEVEAANGVGVPALGGVEGEGAGEAVFGGKGAGAGCVSGALRVSGGEERLEVVWGKDGSGMVEGVGWDGVFLQGIVSGIELEEGVGVTS